MFWADPLWVMMQIGRGGGAAGLGRRAADGAARQPWRQGAGHPPPPAWGRVQKQGWGGEEGGMGRFGAWTLT